MHKKKCDICGMPFDESDDVSYLMIHGPAKCPYCEKILSLKDFVIEYSNAITSARLKSEIYNRNFYLDNPSCGGGNCQSYSLGEHTEEYAIEGRTKDIDDLIDRIDFARRFLVTRVGAQFEIMDSIYERKDAFWNETGTLLNFVHEASLQYIVIKLRELMGGTSKYSIGRIKRTILGNPKAIYEKQKITLVFAFKKTGDVLKIPYPRFPIEEYLAQVDAVMDDYKVIKNAIETLRDKEFAHLDGTNVDEAYKRINYVGLKRVFKSIQIIYDGLLYSMAPDKYTSIHMDYNMWFGYLNEIVEFWKKNNGDGVQLAHEDFE